MGFFRAKPQPEPRAAMDIVMDSFADMFDKTQTVTLMMKWVKGAYSYEFTYHEEDDQ